MDCSTPGLLFPISWRLLKFMSIESGMLSNHLILCHFPLLLPSIFLSIRVFSSEFGSSHQVDKVLELQHQSFSEYSGLISLGLTGLISLLSKKLSRVFSSIIWKHRFFGTQPFFMVQLSHPYSMTTGKTIALLYEQLLAKWCLCFLIQCLGLL